MMLPFTGNVHCEVNKIGEIFHSSWNPATYMKKKRFLQSNRNVVLQIIAIKIWIVQSWELKGCMVGQQELQQVGKIDVWIFIACSLEANTITEDVLNIAAWVYWYAVQKVDSCHELACDIHICAFLLKQTNQRKYFCIQYKVSFLEILGF